MHMKRAAAEIARPDEKAGIEQTDAAMGRHIDSRIAAEPGKWHERRRSERGERLRQNAQPRKAVEIEADRRGRAGQAVEHVLRDHALTIDRRRKEAQSQHLAAPWRRGALCGAAVRAESFRARGRDLITTKAQSHFCNIRVDLHGGQRNSVAHGRIH